MDKLKNNLASIAALIAAVIAIGGGFAKFGEMQTKLDALSNAKGVDISGIETTIQNLEKNMAIVQTENKLFKAMLEEIKAESNNPLAN
jgi:uncharacterized protein HemX